ncbi:MAG: hypothetical protein OEV40_10315 [Acidimicrobiia bacterium]|nr:hypothetical protein [Acidimicrobiia bacterium]
MRTNGRRSRGALGLVIAIAVVVSGAATLLALRSLGERQAPMLGSETIEPDVAASFGLVTRTDDETPSTTSSASPDTVPASPDAGEAADADPEPEPSPPAGSVRSYSMAGGVVTVRFAEGEASLVSIELNEPFTAETSTIDGRLQVDLRDGDRHSQLSAWVEPGTDDGVKVILDDH